jgi:hypothetical protein
MIVGCYSLDLYCENAEKAGDMHGTGRDGIHDYQEFPMTFTSDRRQECEREARSIGWMINNKTGICLCPKCSRKNIRSSHDR